MTTTATGAYEAIRAHHQALGDGLADRADAVVAAATAGKPHEPAVADLIAYVGEKVLPHAAAEEKTIYPAVVARTGLGGMVGEMITETAFLSMSTTRLTTLTSGAAAAEQAQQIAELFATHAAKENDVLLPALLADTTLNLAELLRRVHPNLESHAAAAATRDEDTRATVSTALHGHVRDVNGAVLAGSAGAGVSASDPDLDVRELRPAQRHAVILATYLALAPGAGFVLINDHDPRPLWYQFEAEYTGRFTWDYLESGPRVYRVRIGRTSA